MMSYYRARKLIQLNQEKQAKAKKVRVRILGMILTGHTKRDIERELGCSQSTINRALQNLSFRELSCMCGIYGDDYFSGVSLSDVLLFEQTGFCYSKYQELYKKREVPVPLPKVPEKARIRRPTPKFSPGVQETAPVASREREPEKIPSHYTGIGEMPKNVDYEVQEPFEERLKRVCREKRLERQRERERKVAEMSLSAITEDDQEDSWY